MENAWEVSVNGRAGSRMRQGLADATVENWAAVLPSTLVHQYSCKKMPIYSWLTIWLFNIAMENHNF